MEFLTVSPSIEGLQIHPSPTTREPRVDFLTDESYPGDSLCTLTGVYGEKKQNHHVFLRVQTVIQHTGK